MDLRQVLSMIPSPARLPVPRSPMPSPAPRTPGGASCSSFLTPSKADIGRGAKLLQLLSKGGAAEGKPETPVQKSKTKKRTSKAKAAASSSSQEAKVREKGKLRGKYRKRPDKPEPDDPTLSKAYKHTSPRELCERARIIRIRDHIQVKRMATMLDMDVQVLGRLLRHECVRYPGLRLHALRQFSRQRDSLLVSLVEKEMESRDQSADKTMLQELQHHLEDTYGMVEAPSLTLTLVEKWLSLELQLSERRHIDSAVIVWMKQTKRGRALMAAHSVGEVVGPYPDPLKRPRSKDGEPESIPNGSKRRQSKPKERKKRKAKKRKLTKPPAKPKKEETNPNIVLSTPERPSTKRTLYGKKNTNSPFPPARGVGDEQKDAGAASLKNALSQYRPLGGFSFRPQHPVPIGLASAQLTRTG